MADEVQTYHLHLKGRVQGVGFRPFVYRLAKEFGLTGWVNNASDGVHIELNADRETAEHFFHRLQFEAPPLAVVASAALRLAPAQSFSSFDIVQSDMASSAELLLAPDFALCADCRRELYSPTDARYRYPFITCTNCGPRFSIAKTLPYDRENTTMQPFQMCRRCNDEYHAPLDRRYYAQTNSCPDCSIELSLWRDGEKCATNSDEVISVAIEAFRAGKILAVKGVGGYLLMCDGSNRAAIELLRHRKARPTKPFALLYPNLETLEGDAVLSHTSRRLLTSPESPIVLAPLRKERKTNICIEALAPNLSEIGAMLPYAPLLELLANAFDAPLVATSGNLSGSPIIFSDQDAFEHLAQFADIIISNNRDIVTPQDDSVVRQCDAIGSILIRRSRGYAPSFINPSQLAPLPNTLAMGAHLKAAFALSHRDNLYISQFLGSLENFESQEQFESTLQRFLTMLGATPERIVVDKHPQYFSTQLGETLAKQRSIPIERVQHHEAHFIAVLGENNLLNSAEPILGVVWDGVGLGDDGQIWGGEFFTYNHFCIERCAHFPYFPHLLGDKMSREPRLSALALLGGFDSAPANWAEQFSATERDYYAKVIAQPPKRLTSSIGRFFDGVSSLLGASSKASFEGEAAMRLESMARKFYDLNGLDAAENYCEITTPNLARQAIVERISDDLKRGIDSSRIAANVHFSLVQLVGYVAERESTTRIAMSGGVFQNALLTDLLVRHLGGKFHLYFHKQLSPNDENIAYGQLTCVAVSARRADAAFARVTPALCLDDAIPTE